jgi:magnesium transporter
MLSFNETTGHISSEQISLILGEHFLFSFQEPAGDVFDQVRQRIRQAKGRIRRSGCDYLAYALTDAVVDHYFGVPETRDTLLSQTGVASARSTQWNEF